MKWHLLFLAYDCFTAVMVDAGVSCIEGNTAAITTDKNNICSNTCMTASIIQYDIRIKFLEVEFVCIQLLH